MIHVPIKALAMVILSHILSRTSRPDSGQAMALATVAMSLWMERWKSSNPGRDRRTYVKVNKGNESHPNVRDEIFKSDLFQVKIFATCI